MHRSVIQNVETYECTMEMKNIDTALTRLWAFSFCNLFFFFRFPIYRADGESLTGEARREGTKCLEAPRLAAVLTSSCQRPSNKLNETTSLGAESG